MANARAIVKRRKAVSNICKITRTMQLIATARFQKTHQRAVRAHAYTQGIADLAAELAGLSGEIRHPLLETNSESGKSILLVITSNRGLCGGYNGNLIRTALAAANDRREQGLDVEMEMVGRKGIAYCKFAGQPVTNEYTQFEDEPAYDDVEAIADQYIGRYTAKGVDRIEVVYMRFISAGVQQPEVLSLLPIGDIGQAAKQGEALAPEAIPSEHYDFSPEPEQLLADILPAAMKVRLYQCFMDAAVSEQVARMVAMKAATDAAGDMIRMLSQQYNRARQSQITLELLDILGGTEALK